MKKISSSLIILFFAIFLLSACASDVSQQKKPVSSVISSGEGVGNNGAAVEQTPEEITSTGIADLDKAASELDELGDV